MFTYDAFERPCLTNLNPIILTVVLKEVAYFIIHKHCFCQCSPECYMSYVDIISLAV